MRPASIKEVALRRAMRPDQPLWKPLGEFLDAFYEAEEGRADMLRDEPDAAIDRRELAYLAAAAEHLSDLYEFAPPVWVERPVYFLPTAYWPDRLGRAFEAICIAESPTSFRRRFIFTEGRPLRRKAGPRFAA